MIYFELWHSPPLDRMHALMHVSRRKSSSSPKIRFAAPYLANGTPTSCRSKCGLYLRACQPLTIQNFSCPGGWILFIGTHGGATMHPRELGLEPLLIIKEDETSDLCPKRVHTKLTLDSWCTRAAAWTVPLCQICKPRPISGRSLFCKCECFQEWKKETIFHWISQILSSFFIFLRWH